MSQKSSKQIFQKKKKKSGSNLKIERWQKSGSVLWTQKYNALRSKFSHPGNLDHEFLHP